MFCRGDFDVDDLKDKIVERRGALGGDAGAAIDDVLRGQLRAYSVTVQWWYVPTLQLSFVHILAEGTLLLTQDLS